MIWTRRRFLAHAGIATAAPAAVSPNILVVMSDQESSLLPGHARLPNRERVLGRGISYTNAFCNTPQCSPARSSLLTGLEPHRSGVLTNVDGSSLGKPLDPKLPTIGSVLRKAGYATGYFGKWHLGEQGPTAHGFAHALTPGGDQAIAQATAAWISTQKQPWLAWVSLLNPHHIYDIRKVLAETRARPGVKAPVTSLENLKTKPVEQRAYVDQDQGKITREFTSEDWIKYRSFYLDLVEKADTQLGLILDNVDLDNTILAYTSDHGDALGEHGLAFKGPFMYEELIRIPLAISAPKVRHGRNDEFFTQADLSPKLVELAGVQWPGKGALQARDAVFLEYYAKQKWVNPIRTIRTAEWKLNWYDSGQKELYNLRADPHEKTNLAGETATTPVQSNLEKRLEAWRAPLTSP